MSTRKVFTTSVLPILILLLFTGPATAKRPEASPPINPREFLLRTPEDRMQGWRDGLLTFMAEHRDLTSEQESAIQNLASFDDPASFTYNLEPTQIDLFAERLDELGSVLSYRGYLGLLRSFDDELRVWLVDNGLASQAEAATDNCDCTQGASSTGCSAGVTCSSVDCTHKGGTTHNGVCGGGISIEE